jgi:hypothetical protein
MVPGEEDGAGASQAGVSPLLSLFFDRCGN